MMPPLYARVARRANLGGLPIGEQAVAEIDRLLKEEAAVGGVEGGDAERLPEIVPGTHYSPRRTSKQGVR